MSDTRADWQQHWARLADGGHRYRTDEWLQFYARELQLYFPKGKLHALELGCGSGDLYNFLQAQFATYVGLDFSPGMLAKFNTRCPNVTVICGDATHLPLAKNSYNFIFSNQVCQYLSREMLSCNLKQVYNLLEAGGVYLIGNILDAELQLFYYAGALRNDRNPSYRAWLYALRRFARVTLQKTDEDLGYWYSRRTIARLAVEQGFTCQTFSSAGYEYRFHAILQKRKAER